MKQAVPEEVSLQCSSEVNFMAKLFFLSHTAHFLLPFQPLLGLFE